jgi:glycosyltransferase involved in cell wall biosynthesis
MSIVKKIIASANQVSEKEKLNILTFATHERYEEQLCKTGHNFYAFTTDQMKKWNTTYANIPNNYIIMPEGKIIEYVDFDLILSQDRFYQFGTAKKIQQHLRVPLVALEHTMLGPQSSQQQRDYMKNQVADINVFISEFSREYVGINHNTTIIHHSVDTEKFCNKEQDRQKMVLSVANDFINRDFCLNFSGWNRIVQDFPHTLVGDNPGMSEAATPEELVNFYNSHLVFLNTTTHSPIPTVLLEAMSCGCAVVSTSTCMIPEIIKHGENGFLSNDEEELKQYISYLFKNPEEAKRIGSNARKTILEKFNEKIFLEQWNKVFRSLV